MHPSLWQLPLLNGMVCALVSTYSPDSPGMKA